MKTVFFDLDGVLADFVSGALSAHGATLPYRDVKWDFCSQIGFNGTNDPAFWAPMNYNFWLNLGKLADGFELLGKVEQLVGKERIGILTSPSSNDGAVDGKLAWVKQHLPQYARRCIVTPAKELIAAPGKLLIDDHDGNVDKWEAAQGDSLLFPRPWNVARSVEGSYDLYSYVHRWVNHEE